MSKKGILDVRPDGRIMAVRVTKEGLPDKRAGWNRHEYWECHLKLLGFRRMKSQALEQGYQVRYSR